MPPQKLSDTVRDNPTVCTILRTTVVIGDLRCELTVNALSNLNVLKHHENERELWYREKPIVYRQ